MRGPVVTGPKQHTADVAEVLNRWRAENLSDIDRAILEPLLPQLHEHVLAADPVDAQDARRTLRPLAHRPHTWRGPTRATLRAVGRAVAPKMWPTPPVPVTRPYVCPTYDAREEESYRLAAELLRTTAYRAARTFVVAGALGAGLNAAEMARAHPRDVEELDEGRLAMRVKGRHPRLVPVRREDSRRDP